MRVPILCYHRVEVPPAGSESDTNFVTPAQFASHLSALSRLGFQGVTVGALIRWQRAEQTLPARPIAITFDDAYSSVTSQALPALAKHGWPCTVYAVSSYVGARNVWDPGAPPSTLLNATALRALVRDGHDVGSHTRHHRRVRGLSAADAHEELAGARDDLEQLLGVPCESVAFPYGSHDRETLERTREAGYAAALTLKRWGNGRRTNPWRLGRMSVGGPLSSGMLVAKLVKCLLTPSVS